MCDNLPCINADQLTRAVAGTLSALDAPEEDEAVADENGISTFLSSSLSLCIFDGSQYISVVECRWRAGYPAR